jgi:hypothetical protein
VRLFCSSILSYGFLTYDGALGVGKAKVGSGFLESRLLRRKGFAKPAW